MSFFDPFHNHPIIVGFGIACAGFGSGIAFDKYFADHRHQVESVESNRLSNDVSILKEQVLSKDETINTLSSELAKTRSELLQQQNLSGSNSLSSQALNQKYSDVSQSYKQLSGMYSNLEMNYRKAQQNCVALNRIDVLEQKRRNLENQLTSVGYDVFEKDMSSKKEELKILLAQNHEQLMSLQQQLSR